MNWDQVCERKDLRDLPFKIELNKFGQIVMSPASNFHGQIQARLTYFLMKDGHEDSRVITECSVDTTDGTKVADVSWLSPEFWKSFGSETPYSTAPDLCVEILSPSNTKNEMEFKRALYFEAGAKEVLICNENAERVMLLISRSEMGTALTIFRMEPQSNDL